MDDKNKLKVNDSKTDFMIMVPKRPNVNLDNCVLKVGDSEIKPETSLKILGAYFDKHMSMEKQISSVIRSAYNQIRTIGKIRYYLDYKTISRIIHALVTSRLDYGNSLLAGLPSKSLKRLQLVQNRSARLLTGANKREHITPVLKHLHWLPICERIKYKTAVLTHKCLYSLTTPTYLCDLISVYKPARALRSSDDHFQLRVPKTQKTDGDCSFAKIAPDTWNKLPISLREQSSCDVFKKCLKTTLFLSYYQ
jgi:hypothetical protein